MTQAHELCARLRKMAGQSSEIARMMAQDKSLRQADHNPPRDDLYFWPTPEQTPEWQAADLIQSLTTENSALREQVGSLFNAIAHGDEDHRAWLKEAIDAHFTGEAVPPCQGKGRKEAENSALAARVEELRADGPR